MERPTENSHIVHKAIRDPAAMYVVPENVVADTRLSFEEKHHILESWELDQKRLMESEDENMTQVRKGRPSAAAMYQKIRETIRTLEESVH